MNSNIQFQCGFCHTVLTVPAQMAGISGPCPSCGQTITSPSPAFQPTPQWQPAMAGVASHSTPPSPAMSGLDMSAATLAPQPNSGLPPKRLPGQPPQTMSLGTPPGASLWPANQSQGGAALTMAESTMGSGIANASRLIPGSPSLSNGGTSSLAGATLLGRDIPPAPISPLTQPLSGQLPPISLAGGGNTHENPHSATTHPFPSGRSIGSLKTSRGTNLIRLCLAALFLLGFLGVVGIAFKDYLPGILPSIAGSTDAGVGSESIPPPSNQTTHTQASPKPLISTPSTPLLAEKGTQEGVTASAHKTAPSTTQFDPAEVIPKAQPATPTEIAEMKKTSHINDASTLPPEIASSAKVQPPSETLLEIPAKAASAATPSPVQVPLSGGSSTQHAIEESDIPPEARPAVEALKKFLTAKNLDDRLRHTLGAEHMKPLMTRYYTRTSDGPVAIDRIQFVRIDPNPELGSGKHCILSIENKTWEFPVPVMLEEQPDGFKVDWLAFVEFKDRLLEHFFQNYQEGRARFHVGILRTHYFDDGVPGLEGKDAFRIMPAPPNSFPATAFLEKNTPLAQELRTRIPWETHVWAVVELEWKKSGSQQWVELGAVPQMHWYSLPLVPHPVSTPNQSPEEEKLPPGIKKNGRTSTKGLSPGVEIPPPTSTLPPTVRRPIPMGR